MGNDYTKIMKFSIFMLDFTFYIELSCKEISMDDKDSTICYVKTIDVNCANMNVQPYYKVRRKKSFKDNQAHPSKTLKQKSICYSRFGI